MVTQRARGYFFRTTSPETQIPECLSVYVLYGYFLKVQVQRTHWLLVRFPVDLVKPLKLKWAVEAAKHQLKDLFPVEVTALIHVLCLQGHSGLETH